MPTTKVSTLVAGMFITGCANSLITKFQDMQCVEGCEPGSTEPRLDFEQPVWQTLNMFIAEFSCIIPLIITTWRSSSPNPAPTGDVSIISKLTARLRPGAGPGNAPQGYSQVASDEDVGEETVKVDSEQPLAGWAMCWMWFPAFFDICATTLLNVGLILTPVSIFQMTRGSLVLWVGALSVIFLKRKLWLYQWTSLVIVTMGVCLVGLSGSLISKATVPDHGNIIERLAAVATGDDDAAKVAFGVFLILFAQIFAAVQYVVEEKIMSFYHIEPLAAVSLEGFFGLITTLAAMPVLHIAFRDRVAYFDVPRGWRQITGNSTVLWAFLAEAFSVGAFNFFGLSVTSQVSATTRSTVDTCRTLGIWIVSLSLRWEKLVFPFSLLQVTGFAMLVYGTFVFNGLVKPFIFPPPSSIHLPHEPELEETAILPAAEGQGRVGYDVLPEPDANRRSS